MRALALLAAWIALPAHADLYRWIDPESGSVKLSTMPPTDPAIGAQIVPFKAPAAPKPPAAVVVSKPSPPTGSVEALQVRWSELLTRLSGASPQDFSRGGEGVRQQIQAYEAVRIELDRLDPAGAARRRAEAASVFEKLK